MDTNKLIDDLSADLKPVTPLATPASRAALFVLFLILTGMAILFVTGLRHDIRGVMTEPRFITENLMLLMAGISAAFAAFHLSIPDTKIRKPVLLALLAATSIWAVIGFICCCGIMDGREHAGIGMEGMPCIKDLSVMIALPLVVVMIMMRRAAPVWSHWAGFGAVLSVGSFGAVAMRLLCPNDDPAHLLLWHFLPVLAFAACGVMLGKILFKK